MRDDIKVLGIQKRKAIYTKGVEQITKADLLAVTLFEDREDGTNQKGAPAYAGGLVPTLKAKVDI